MSACRKCCSYMKRLPTLPKRLNQGSRARGQRLKVSTLTPSRWPLAPDLSECAMHRFMLCSLFVSVAFAGRAAAFETDARIKKIDMEKRVLLVFAGGQDRRVRVA